MGKVAPSQRERAHAGIIMKHLRLSRSLATLALTGALSVTMLGAAIDGVTTADSDFAHQAMTMLLQSVANADPAQSNGSADVKALASKVQTDEIGIGKQLASLANYYGINVSTTAAKPSTDASGYAADQAKSLESLITIFENEAQNGGGAQLRSFASASLPTLQADLKAVQAQT